jgi:hypothetical protein
MLAWRYSNEGAWTRKKEGLAEPMARDEIWFSINVSCNTHDERKLGCDIRCFIRFSMTKTSRLVGLCYGFANARHASTANPTLYMN